MVAIAPTDSEGPARRASAGAVGSDPRRDGPAEPRPRAPGEASWPWTFITWAVVISLLTVGAVATVLVGGLAALLGDRDRRVAHRILVWAYNAVTTLHPRYRVTVTGRENLPAGGFVLCPNHQSYSDVVYLFRLGLQFKWVVKRELFFVPLFGPAMWVAGYPAIRRGDSASAQRLMARVLRYLERGVPVLSFPEGSRSASGTLQPFTKGPARMAMAAQVPLVPVGVVGTGRLLPKGSAMYPAHAHLAIHIGPPIPTAGRDPRSLRAITAELREAVIAAKARAQAEVDGARGGGVDSPAPSQ